jgi:hypothetical protein
MGHVSPFETFKFQKLFNDIRNLSIQWVLALAIVFWRFGSPTPKVGACLGVWGFIPSHFSTLSRVWNVTTRLHFWSAPLQALTLVTSPRLGLRHLPSISQVNE